MTFKEIKIELIRRSLQLLRMDLVNLNFVNPFLLLKVKINKKIVLKQKKVYNFNYFK